MSLQLEGFSLLSACHAQGCRLFFQVGGESKKVAGGQNSFWCWAGRFCIKVAGAQTRSSPGGNSLAPSP